MTRFLNPDRFVAAIAWGCIAVLCPISIAPAEPAPPHKEAPARKSPSKVNDLEKRKEDLNKQSEAAFESQDYKAAEAIIRSLIEIDGENFVPWYNLACSLSMQGRTEDAGPVSKKPSSWVSAT